MIDDPRYSPVEALWATVAHDLTTPTRAMAKTAVRRILRGFDTSLDRAMGQVSIASRPAHYIHEVRRVWVGQRSAFDGYLDKGWPRLVHDVSHAIFRVRQPRARPHDPGHDTLELEIAQYVIGQDWHIAVEVKKPKATVDDKLAVLDARIARWTTKQKRATTALRKLNTKRRAMVRRREATLTEDILS